MENREARGPKTLVVLYPGCIEFEILLAAQLLHPQLPVETVTPDGKDHRGHSGLIFRSHAAIADIDPRHYAVVLVPGGDFKSVFDHEPLYAQLKALASHGAVFGAICAGPFLLARAGLLAGRRCSHGFGPEARDFLAPWLRDVRLCDARISLDGNCITARADAWLDFSLALADRLGVVRDPAHRARVLKAYSS